MRAKAEKVVLVVQGRLPPILLVVYMIKFMFIYMVHEHVCNKVYVYLYVGLCLYCGSGCVIVYMYCLVVICE
jgi:hypothetical protein